MIKFENGEGHIEGSTAMILHETKEILRSVREMLEEDMPKENADEWIDKIVRRSAMTEKEELLDSINGIKDGIKKLKEENSHDEKPMPDIVEMLLDVLLDGDGKDQEG